MAMLVGPPSDPVGLAPGSNPPDPFRTAPNLTTVPTARPGLSFNNAAGPSAIFTNTQPPPPHGSMGSIPRTMPYAMPIAPPVVIPSDPGSVRSGSVRVEPTWQPVTQRHPSRVSMAVAGAQDLVVTLPQPAAPVVTMLPGTMIGPMASYSHQLRQPSGAYTNFGSTIGGGPPPNAFFDEYQGRQESDSDSEGAPRGLEDDDDETLVWNRNPMQARTGTDFAGSIPDTAYSQWHAPQAHDVSQADHRVRKAQEAYDLAEKELRNAQIQNHHLQAHLNQHVLNPMPHNMRQVDTDPNRIYQSGAPVLRNGHGIQEADPYPFWVGAGTPAARLEPTWIGGEWYLVAPVDFKGQEIAQKTWQEYGQYGHSNSWGQQGLPQETQNAQIRVVDDALHRLDSQGSLPALPPPRHWKEHKNCPIA